MTEQEPIDMQSRERISEKAPADRAETMATLMLGWLTSSLHQSPFRVKQIRLCGDDLSSIVVTLESGIELLLSAAVYD